MFTYVLQSTRGRKWFLWIGVFVFLLFLLGVLGFDDDENSHILERLYPVLAKEIEQLKTLMAG